jgi:hypothetical protein
MPRLYVIGQDGSKLKRIKLEKIKEYYHLPISVASKELETSETILKRIMRSYGVKRWPYRKLSSLKKIINCLEQLILETNIPNDKKTYQEEIDTYTKFMDLFVNDPNIPYKDVIEKNLLQKFSKISIRQRKDNKRKNADNNKHIRSSLNDLTNDKHLGFSLNDLTNDKHLGFSLNDLTNDKHIRSSLNNLTNDKHLGFSLNGLINNKHLGFSLNGLTNNKHLGSSLNSLTNDKHLGSSLNYLTNDKHLGSSLKDTINDRQIELASSILVKMSHRI